MLCRQIFAHLRSNKRPFLRYYTNKNVLAIAERGIFQDFFPEDAQEEMKKLFEARSQVIYAGFDPTADSLHVGNLLVIVGLLHFQRAGHQPVALLGGATGLIGDPSGRKTERSQLKASLITENLIAIRGQIERIFQNHEKIFWKKSMDEDTLRKVRIVNNTDWYSAMNLIDFVSNIGRHFRMGAMLSRSSVQSRLQSESGMSFTEFSYQTFQAYDWFHLFLSQGCRFQLGGSDQMGNIISGHDLISREENKQVYGITLPIVTNEEGDKFGKSAGNAIWLDERKTSAFALYQFFIRTTDSEVEKMLKLFTFLPIDKIHEIMESHKRLPELRDAQKILAQEITLLIHGEEGLKKAESISLVLYKGNVDALADLDFTDLKESIGASAVCEILPEPGLSVLDLAMKAKCFPTESDAIRIITAGGFHINQKRAKNIAEVISPGIHILKNDLSLLRVGKRNYYIVRWLK